MVYKCFDKKTSTSVIANDSMPDQQLAERLHKQIIRNFSKRKTHSLFIDNIWDGYSRYAIDKQV